jgi:hypothetical protein
MLCLPQIFLNAALSGGILQWRQNTGKIVIAGGILSLRNIVRILLFQVAYFGGEKNTEKMAIRGGMTSPPAQKKRRKYATFGGHTSVTRNTKIGWFFIREKNDDNMALFGECFIDRHLGARKPCVRSHIHHIPAPSSKTDQPGSQSCMSLHLDSKCFASTKAASHTSQRTHPTSFWHKVKDLPQLLVSNFLIKTSSSIITRALPSNTCN